MELTGRCQLECQHCYASSGPSGTHGTMREPDWRRVIDQAEQLGARMVQFIGGEPTLHPALPALIGHALNHDVAVEVFSNLVHVPATLWDVLAQPGVRLATSYYSDDPRQHRAITQRPTHGRTTENIREALRRSIPLRVGVIDVHDGQRSEQAVNELRALGVTNVGTDRLRELGRGGGQSAAQLCGRCGDGAVAVSPDGSVWPCVMSRWMAVGNVHEKSLQEIVAALPGVVGVLREQGMPASVGVQQCGPDCAPSGGQCYPINCYPR
ncbi:MAG: radical SAM protein [Pseudonocardiaceae bacterium]|nr:radical SAM protein [Pseudonocardiaceae bacterium]